MDDNNEGDKIGMDPVNVNLQPGESLTPAEIPSPEVESQASPPVAPEEISKKRNLIISIVVAALLLFGGGAYLVWQAVSGDDSDSATTAKQVIPLLRVSTQDGPLNLIYTGVTNEGALTVNSHLYEGLVTYENVSQIVPLLATSWTNPDDQTWLFTLKENIKFHNGRTMTAEDVKYSLDNAANVGPGELGASIVSVEVVDPTTVKITTDGPDPLLLSQLVGLWIVDSTDIAEGQNPSGTGPYVIKQDSILSETSAELTAFEDYHGGIVYTQELHFIQMSIAEAVAAFNDGEIDVASTLVSDSEDLNLADQQLINISDFTVAFLGINSLNPESPLSNLQVRQAIAKAIDPEAVITAQEVKGEVVDQFVTADIPGYNPAIERLPFSVDDARALLTEAGFGNGFTVKLSYATTNNQGMFDTIQSQLAAIGITVTPDFYGDDQDAMFNTVFGGASEMFFLAYAPNPIDASDTFGTVFAGGAENPYYNNSQIDTLLGQAASTLDESERLTVLKDIGTILSDDVAAIPLYSRDQVTALNGPYVVKRDLPGSGSGFLFNKVYLP